MKAKKTFSLEDFCEPLMDDPSYFSKKMFGGLAIYFNDLMVFTLTESPGEKSWKGIEFDYEIWNGVLVCTSREHHQQLKQKHPELINHPILGKWLYVPMDDPNFESCFNALVEEVLEGSPLIGIVPGQSRKK